MDFSHNNIPAHELHGSPKPKFKVPKSTQLELTKIGQDLERIELQLNNLVNAIEAKTKNKFDNLITHIAKTRKNIKKLNENSSREETQEIIKKHNENARKINKIFLQLQMSHELSSIPQYEYTEEEQKEIVKLAENLYKEIFTESNINTFVKWATDQKELDGYQKVILAPANGIESILSGIISLFDAQTYKDLSATIKTMSNLSYEDWCAAVKAAKDAFINLESSDKWSGAIQFICSCTFLFGGVAKLQKLIKTRKTKIILSGTFSTIKTNNTVLPAISLPLLAITGTAIPYIDEV